MKSNFSAFWIFNSGAYKSGFEGPPLCFIGGHGGVTLRSADCQEPSVRDALSLRDIMDHCFRATNESRQHGDAAGENETNPKTREAHFPRR